MIVALLAMLFMLVSAYIILARFDRQTLQMTSRANEVERILDGVSAVAGAAVRGPRGSDLVSGTSYVDIPGYGGVDSSDPNDPNRQWGSPWLASGEPVRDPYGGPNPASPVDDYVVPAVTGFSGPATGRRLDELMLDDPSDIDTSGYVDVRPGSSSAETLLNARQPFADADGDGMPDSRFGSVGLLTEMANALGGRSVRATNVDPSNLYVDPGDPNTLANYLAWQQYDSTARYAVAAKIVSHGGMVQVSAPTDELQWNSEFIGGMFNWILHPLDGGGLYPALNLTDREQLQAMWAARGSVEPALRRRGGIIGGTGANTDVGEPFALRTLSNRFRWTFGGAYDSAMEQYRWQRFNLASLTDWNAWRNAATLDPEWYNEWFGGMASDPRLTYAQRQLLTTVNHSDELARIEESKPAGWAGTGLRPGDTKFYLGNIASAFDPVTGAFLPTEGRAVIARLVDYFAEMLYDYDDWGDEGVTPGDQARMLAVNTVAFAAPRDSTTGEIDTVYYLDDPDSPTKIYIGYKPQPFITQVVAYNENTDEDERTRIALAVEIYNPHDSAATGVWHDLDLSRYAVSMSTGPYTGVETPADGSLDLGLLGQGLLDTLGVPRLPGRAFLLFAIPGSSNNYFGDQQAAGNLPSLQGNVLLKADAANYDPNPGVPPALALKLWHSSPSGYWYVVDQMDVDLGSLPTDHEWYVNVKRDTTYEEYLGRWNLTGPEARWRMVVDFPKNDPGYKRDDVLDAAPLGVLPQLGFGEDAAAAGVSYGPCVPLYTMNADMFIGGVPNATWLHGAPRPPSFPTVGFMQFVPRFSHVEEYPGTSSVVRRPMGEVLFEHWDERGHSAMGYPADFGHMPVFDNRQGVKAGSAFADSRTGRVPWGLLVFDYFTTLNPYDADGNGVADGLNDPNDAIDPYRVPGRININTASWYVLAGLPLIGPDGSGNLPLDPSASPAFWSAASGVLVGEGSETPARPRYPELVDTTWATGGQWYRLGPYLAQAAAAYRDRVPYVSGNPTLAPLGLAWQRNNPNSPHQPLRYRSELVYGPDSTQYAGGIRGGGSTSTARGFLTLGELANVLGFDGSLPSDIAADTLQGAGTVLGGYGNFVGGDFMKAVSLLALLDTHFLTTRSNTFTVYTTLYDRENPQASVRSQVTLDRSNLLPRLIWQDTNGNGIPDAGDTYTPLQSTGSPELIARRDYSYFNAQYDQ